MTHNQRWMLLGAAVFSLGAQAQDAWSNNQDVRSTQSAQTKEERPKAAEEGPGTGGSGWDPSSREKEAPPTHVDDSDMNGQGSLDRSDARPDRSSTSE